MNEMPGLTTIVELSGAASFQGFAGQLLLWVAAFSDLVEGSAGKAMRSRLCRVLNRAGCFKEK
jgi:hypothetical protein